jgi:hypothetical protein
MTTYINWTWWRMQTEEARQAHLAFCAARGVTVVVRR